MWFARVLASPITVEDAFFYVLKMWKINYRLLLTVPLALVASVILLQLQAFAPPVSGNVCPIMNASSEPPPLAVPTEAEVRIALLNPWAIEPVATGHIGSETLWLARLMFSESKRLDEQELVAWVVRNRAETAYRGQTTFEGIARDPFQFSAFNPGTAKGRFYSELDILSDVPGWQKTLALAYYVYHADRRFSPFPLTVRHFYSEQAMAEPGGAPEWSVGRTPVVPQRNFSLDEHRFRFYANVI